MGGRERGRERDRHWLTVPVIYIFIVWFLYVLWLGIQPVNLAFRCDVLTIWAIWPGLTFFFCAFKYNELILLVLIKNHVWFIGVYWWKFSLLRILRDFSSWFQNLFFSIMFCLMLLYSLISLSSIVSANAFVYLF